MLAIRLFANHKAYILPESMQSKIGCGIYVKLTVKCFKGEKLGYFESFVDDDVGKIAKRVEELQMW